MRHPTLLLALLTASLMGTQAKNAANLANVYDSAVQNDPQIAAAKASYLATRENVPQARAGLLPTNDSCSDNPNHIAPVTKKI